MKKIRAGIDASISASVEVQAGIPLAIQEKSKPKYRQGLMLKLKRL